MLRGSQPFNSVQELLHFLTHLQYWRATSITLYFDWRKYPDSEYVEWVEAEPMTIGCFNIPISELGGRIIRHCIKLKPFGYACSTALFHEAALLITGATEIIEEKLNIEIEKQLLA
jgi:hypothetical protein